jgi:hypothetical protein
MKQRPGRHTQPFIGRLAITGILLSIVLVNAQAKDNWTQQSWPPDKYDAYVSGITSLPAERRITTFLLKTSDDFIHAGIKFPNGYETTGMTQKEYGWQTTYYYGIGTTDTNQDPEINTTNHMIQTTNAVYTLEIDEAIAYQEFAFPTIPIDQRLLDCAENMNRRLLLISGESPLAVELYRFERDFLVTLKQRISNIVGQFADPTKAVDGSFDEWFSKELPDGSYPSDFPRLTLDRLCEITPGLPYEIDANTNAAKTWFDWTPSRMLGGSPQTPGTTTNVWSFQPYLFQQPEMVSSGIMSAVTSRFPLIDAGGNVGHYAIQKPILSGDYKSLLGVSVEVFTTNDVLVWSNVAFSAIDILAFTNSAVNTNIAEGYGAQDYTFKPVQAILSNLVYQICDTHSTSTHVYGVDLRDPGLVRPGARFTTNYWADGDITLIDALNDYGVYYVFMISGFSYFGYIDKCEAMTNAGTRIHYRYSDELRFALGNVAVEVPVEADVYCSFMTETNYAYFRPTQFIYWIDSLGVWMYKLEIHGPPYADFYINSHVPEYLMSKNDLWHRVKSLILTTNQYALSAESDFSITPLVWITDSVSDSARPDDQGTDHFYWTDGSGFPRHMSWPLDNAESVLVAKYGSYGMYSCSLEKPPFIIIRHDQ